MKLSQQPSLSSKTRTLAPVIAGFVFAFSCQLAQAGAVTEEIAYIMAQSGATQEAINDAVRIEQNILNQLSEKERMNREVAARKRINERRNPVPLLTEKPNWITTLSKVTILSGVAYTVVDKIYATCFIPQYNPCIVECTDNTIQKRLEGTGAPNYCYPLPFKP